MKRLSIAAAAQGLAAAAWSEYPDKPVTIEEPRGIIRGRGLEFDNKAKTVRLKSQVSGTFQPQDLPK